MKNFNYSKSYAANKNWFLSSFTFLAFLFYLFDLDDTLLGSILCPSQQVLPIQPSVSLARSMLLQSRLLQGTFGLLLYLPWSGALHMNNLTIFISSISIGLTNHRCSQTPKPVFAKNTRARINKMKRYSPLFWQRRWWYEPLKR